MLYITIRGDEPAERDVCLVDTNRLESHRDIRVSLSAELLVLIADRVGGSAWRGVAEGFGAEAVKQSAV